MEKQINSEVINSEAVKIEAINSGAIDSKATKETNNGAIDSKATKETNNGAIDSKATKAANNGAIDSKATKETNNGAIDSKATEATNNGAIDSKATEATKNEAISSKAINSEAINDKSGLKSRVAIVGCKGYEYDQVKSAIKRGIDLLGGTEQFCSEGEKILLKPNLLAADPPEKCSTTHYNVVKAVAAVFIEARASVSYGDSPGIHTMQAAAGKALIAHTAAEVGAKPADFDSGKEIISDKSKYHKKFIIANGVLEADGIISLPKLKTHGLTKITGCIKNQFGCIPGSLKAEYHYRLPDLIDFCKMLVDLNTYVNPRLYIMDGIIAMEGNGPRGGSRREMNVLLFSRDPIALDATVCRMVKLDPSYVPTIITGQEMGAGVFESEKIELVGDPFEDFIQGSFTVRKDPPNTNKILGKSNLISRALVMNPYIVEKKCIKCGVCVNVCPVNPKAINWRSEKLKSKNSGARNIKGENGSVGISRDKNSRKDNMTDKNGSVASGKGKNSRKDSMTDKNGNVATGKGKNSSAGNIKGENSSVGSGKDKNSWELKKKSVPLYNYDNCIRCYCCQEMCPESAIRLRENLERKILNFLLPIFKRIAQLFYK